jgi:hypothetical protein
MNYDEAFISNLLQYNQADIKVTEAENNLNEAKSDENNILTQYKDALIRKAKMEAWTIDKKYVENIELEIERYKELND